MFCFDVCLLYFVVGLCWSISGACLCCLVVSWWIVLWVLFGFCFVV